MVTQNYSVGIIKVIVILGFLNTGALLLVGVENAMFFGIFAAVLAAVPFFGGLMGSLLPILFVFITRESLYYALAVARGLSF